MTARGIASAVATGGLIVAIARVKTSGTAVRRRAVAITTRIGSTAGSAIVFFVNAGAGDTGSGGAAGTGRITDN